MKNRTIWVISSILLPFFTYIFLVIVNGELNFYLWSDRMQNDFILILCIAEFLTFLRYSIKKMDESEHETK